jgi:UDP-glucose 4-epimerase
MRALEPDNASILVCGGAGVGLHTTRKLKDMGAWVWMLQRTDNNRPEIEKMMAFCVRGDAMDKASVTKAFDSALSTQCYHSVILSLIGIVQINS